MASSTAALVYSAAELISCFMADLQADRRRWPSRPCWPLKDLSKGAFSTQHIRALTDKWTVWTKYSTQQAPWRGVRKTTQHMLTYSELSTLIHHIVARTQMWPGSPWPVCYLTNKAAVALGEKELREHLTHGCTRAAYIREYEGKSFPTLSSEYKAVLHSSRGQRLGWREINHHDFISVESNERDSYYLKTSRLFPKAQHLSHPLSFFFFFFWFLQSSRNQTKQ